MNDDPRRPARGADLLTVIFGSTLVIWSVLYVASMPPGFMPTWLTAAIVALVLLGGGVVAGRAGRTWRGGLACGLGVGLIGLLVLASILGEDVGRGLGLAGGFIAGAGVLGAAGAAIGHRTPPASGGVNWTARLAIVTFLTVLCMIAAGGVVTGLEAGLAVEGWLNAEGHFLPLFPLEMMRRDVPTFVEHAHRLWGLLVGLSTIVLAVHLWMVDRRGGLRGGAAAVVLVVVLQGVLGGTRVTEDSVALGIVHGILAQLILAALLVIASAVTAAWTDPAPDLPRSGSTDRTMSVVLAGAVLLQVTVGTVFRHIQPDPETPKGLFMGMLHGHAFVGSLLVVVLVILVGVRALKEHRQDRLIKRASMALMHTLGVQVILGIAAFVVIPTSGPRPPDETITVTEVAVTTAHQVIGALLLSQSIVLAAWLRRRA